MGELTLLDVFKYPNETLFKSSLGVVVKTVGKFDKILYYQRPSNKNEWKVCPNDYNYATAMYTLIENKE